MSEQETAAFLAMLGRRIKQLRKDKKLLMRDIMIRSGYYNTQWRKYETGFSLTIPSLLRVAVALDVTVDELLDGLGQWPKLRVAEIQPLHSLGVSADQRKLEQDPGLQQIPFKQQQVQMKRGVKKKATRLKESLPAKKVKANPSVARKSSR